MKTSVWLAILFAFSPGNVRSEEQQGYETVLEEMSRASEALTTLQADLVQVKSYPQLSLSDPPEKGRLYVQRTDAQTRLRLTILEPEPRSVAVTDGEYVFYQPKINQALVGKLAGHGGRGNAAFLSYLLGDLTDAEEDFDIRVLGEDVVDGEPTVCLRLSAKSGSKSPYLQIDLWVHTELWLPIRQELTEVNRSLTRIDLQNISINEDIDERVFEIELPRDVERVRG